MGVAIAVQELRKNYGALCAVDGISFQVDEGEIFGMVGPNGAGKTTTIECVEGLRRPDGGEVRVLGLDPQRDGRALRRIIGVQLQECALPDRLRVGEALALFASFYENPLPPRTLLEELGLADKVRTPFAQLSGGQKQRLFIALALVGNPRIVFLDELTTGLDPQARRAMWGLVQQVRERGKTVFLTTHYMEEAERLCDRVLIIDHGRILALDTPENLIRSLGAESRVVLTCQGATDQVLEALRAQAGVTRVERSGEQVIVYGRGEGLVATVVNTLNAAGRPFRDLRTEQPNLEDVFLTLTGREMRD